MSETKHTPGPWKVTNLTDVFTTHRRGNPLDGFQVADCSVDYDSSDDPCIPTSEKRANARLIAAAPTMLKVLKKISRPHSCGCVPCTGVCTSKESLEIILDEIRGAALEAVKFAEEGR